MSQPNGKLCLPRLLRATLRHFTLYNLEREINIEFGDGVFCLAGANGLGKSTFLLALNYAITGRVPDPDRTFNSVEEYYTRTLDFSRDFFDGRIRDRDRDRAEVEIEVQVADWQLCLRRGMFTPDELRQLWLQEDDGDLYEVDGSPTELHEQYCREITKKTGLASFEQLVFLQHFVLTFDERRNLLFWNPRELDQTIHLAFGVDSKTAKNADNLRRKIDRAESYARNASWDASQVRKKLKELENALSRAESGDLEEVEDEYQKLQDAVDHSRKHAEKVETKLSDANLRLADLSAKQTMLRAEYDDEFSKRVASRADIRHHPLIRSSIAEGRCQLCDSQRDELRAAIEERLKADTCPICGADVKKQGKGKQLNRLKELDKELTAVSADITDAVKRVQRLQVERDATEAQHEADLQALDGFTAQYRNDIARIQAKATHSITTLVNEYRQQIEEHLAEKQEWYKERNKHRDELRPLQRQLEKQYRSAEDVFVPMFKQLAESFLGVDLNVVFEGPKAHGVGLVLNVQGDERREYHHLSESQRFFVDIALRMALIKYMSRGDSPGCLYLDTPEGSLDIAYETRAGRMIAQFANDGFGCVMTANINTSKLLLSLAEECASENMELDRMTTWAELTDVQTEEEGLFDDAFREIEKRIN